MTLEYGLETGGEPRRLCQLASEDFAEGIKAFRSKEGSPFSKVSRQPRHSGIKERPLMGIEKVGVIGFGTMGSGIAQVCAESGYQVDGLGHE